MFKKILAFIKLKIVHQEQLLYFYRELNTKYKNELLKDIKNTNFKQINKLYINSFNNEQININKIGPINYIDDSKLSKKERNEYKLIGENIIKNDKFAIVLMAGGDGKRLGHKGIKGSFPLNINGIKKTIFEILFDDIKENCKKYNINIPIYIMTSENNNKKTIEFFKNNNFFDYKKDFINFFKQNSLPIIDINGKILLEKKYKILKGPNGNGDVFNSLKKYGYIEDMKKRGIEWISFEILDNILMKMVDPILIGLTIKNNYKLSSKSIFKEDINSKEFVFAKYNNKPFMLNYKYIDVSMNIKKDDKGNYLYRDTNIANHLVHIDYVEKFSNINLKKHRSYKNNNYINQKGELVIAENPNSFKFEKFIFDAFEEADDMILYRVNKDEQFAPIKNKEGNNSPKTAVELYIKNKKL